MLQWQVPPRLQKVAILRLSSFLYVLRLRVKSSSARFFLTLKLDLLDACLQQAEPGA